MTTEIPGLEAWEVEDLRLRAEVESLQEQIFLLKRSITNLSWNNSKQFRNEVKFVIQNETNKPSALMALRERFDCSLESALDLYKWSQQLRQ